MVLVWCWYGLAMFGMVLVWFRYWFGMVSVWRRYCFDIVLARRWYCLSIVSILHCYSFGMFLLWRWYCFVGCWYGAGLRTERFTAGPYHSTSTEQRGIGGSWFIRPQMWFQLLEKPRDAGIEISKCARANMPRTRRSWSPGRTKTRPPQYNRRPSDCWASTEACFR